MLENLQVEIPCRVSRDMGKGGDTYYTRVLGGRKGRQGFSVTRKDRIFDFPTEKENPKVSKSDNFKKNEKSLDLDRSVV